MNVKFTYTVLTQTDEAANLTKIQELISSNVDGIICTMDLGMPSIIQECEAAGVYLGGYLCDYDTSYNTSYDQVFKSEYFVGTATDGQNPDDVTIGNTMLDSWLSTMSAMRTHRSRMYPWQYSLYGHSPHSQRVQSSL